MQEGAQNDRLFHRYSMYSSKPNSISMKALNAEVSPVSGVKNYGSNESIFDMRMRRRSLPKTKTQHTPFKVAKRRESHYHPNQDYMHVGEFPVLNRNNTEEFLPCKDEASENEFVLPSQIFYKNTKSKKEKESKQAFMSSHSNIPLYPVKVPFNMQEKERRTSEVAPPHHKNKESSIEVTSKGRLILPSPEITGHKLAPSRSATQLNKYVFKKGNPLTVYQANSTALTPKEVKTSLFPGPSEIFTNPLIESFAKKKNSSHSNLKLLIKNYEQTGGASPKNTFINSQVMTSQIIGSGDQVSESMLKAGNMTSGFSIIRSHIGKPLRIKKKNGEGLKLDAILKRGGGSDYDYQRANTYLSHPLSVNTVNGLSDSKSEPFFVNKIKEPSTFREELANARAKIKKIREGSNNRTRKSKLGNSFEDAVEVKKPPTKVKLIKLSKKSTFHQDSVDVSNIGKSPTKVQIPKLQLSVIHNKLNSNEVDPHKKTSSGTPSKGSTYLTPNLGLKDTAPSTQKTIPASPFQQIETVKLRDLSNQRPSIMSKESKSPTATTLKKSDTQCSTRLNSLGFITPFTHSQHEISQLPTMSTRTSKISLPLNLNKVQRVNFNEEFMQKVDEFSESWRLEAKDIIKKEL